METRKPKKKKLTLSINEAVLEDFSRYCEENALIKSRIIENLVKKFLSDEKKRKGELF